MKIAYLMLVHNNPQLLKKAIEALSSDGCGFFIHVDAKSDIRSFSGISGENVTFTEPRIPVYWGEFSIVRATMRLMRLALESPQGYDYFVFLQGSDYPLQSATYIQRFFAENRDSEFLSLVEMPAPGYPLSRLEAFRYPSTKPLLRFATRALGKIGLARRSYRKHLAGLQAYAGDASWSLSRKACEYIANFTIQNPKVEAFFENTFSAPDEWFYHTILGNSSFRMRCRRTLCYRDYPDNLAHPALISEKHVRFFESQEKVLVEDEWGPGEMLFARKFSDQTLHVTESINEMIRHKK
jgi:Core-2/I-Branching enzyme